MSPAQHADPFLNTGFENGKEYEVQEFRILPMSRSAEFPDHSHEDLQLDFLTGRLIEERRGRFLYRKSGFPQDCGPLYVLFQFDGKIVGSGVLTHVEAFGVPETDDEGTEYHGAYYFDVETLEIFRPLGLEELQAVVPEIKLLSQAKQRIPSHRWKELRALLKACAYSSEECERMRRKLDHD